MRALLLIAGAALALAACGSKSQNGNNQAGDENLTAASIVSNDVTAIDAVTGDAANMAADVNMDFGNLNEVGGGNMTMAMPQQRPTKATARTAAPAEANSVANTAANAATTNAQ